MARYTGANCKLCRRENMKLFLKGERCYKDKCAFERKEYAPGQHGKLHKKLSDYGVQLREKQKAKRIYGVLESQFRRYFEKASSMEGITGEILLQFLERRLDNVVYRAGFASSRKEARQMVKHEHFTVNGRKVSIPSFLVKPGMVVEVKEKSRNHARIVESLETAAGRGIPEWISLDKQNFKANVSRLPERTSTLNNAFKAEDALPMIMMNFRNLIKPKSIEPVGQVSNTYGKFIIEPYEKGFGTTIGNALRRVMLSSIEGTAVVGVRISGVTNEFSTVPGVIEDVVEILLNVKDLTLCSSVPEQTKVFIKKKGKGPVTAGDIQGDGTVEVLDPEQHILTISDDNLELYMELIVERGIGYVPSGEFEDKFNNEIDIMPVDAIFTPIKRVNYHVENARVGQSTDYEMAFAAKIVKDYMTQFINFEEKDEEEADVEENRGNSQVLEMLDNSIEELELSVRAYNCLKNANIKTLYELCSKTDGEMLKTKNFGRKSLEEIKKVLSDLGLSLGMDLESLGYKKKDSEVE